MSAGIDWSAKPMPWCYIGPQLIAEVEAIMADKPLPVVRRTSEGGKLRDKRIGLEITRERLSAMSGLSTTTIKIVENDRGSARAIGIIRNTLARVADDRRMAETQAFAR